MKKVMFVIAIFVIFISLVNAVPIKVQFNDDSTNSDLQGQRLCLAIRTLLNNSKEFEISTSYANNTYIFTIQTYDPEGGYKGQNMRTCYGYFVYRCLDGLPLLLVNSSIAQVGSDRMQEAAEMLVNQFTKDIQEFKRKYPEFTN